MNQYLREEYHQLQDVLWGSGFSRLYAGELLSVLPAVVRCL